MSAIPLGMALRASTDLISPVDDLVGEFKRMAVMCGHAVLVNNGRLTTKENQQIDVPDSRGKVLGSTLSV